MRSFCKGKSRLKYVILCLLLSISGLVLALPADDPSTIGLWHMDEIISGVIPDDDSSNPGRGHDLSLGYGSLTAPSLTTSSGGVFGEAISFNENAIARCAEFWNDTLSGVTIDCWINITAMPTEEAISKYLIECPNNFRLYLNKDEKLYWEIKDPATAGRVSIAVSDKLNQWLHITAAYENHTQQLILNVNDLTVSEPAWRPMLPVASTLEIGHLPGKPLSRGFAGLIDELKISWIQQSPPDHDKVALADNGTSVTLSNGIITGIIQKSNARMTAIYKGDGPNLMGTYWYWDCNGEGLYESVSDASYNLISQSDDQIEVSFKHSGMINGYLDYDVHYILRRGESGFYAFAIMTNATQLPWRLEQARCVVRNSPDIFYKMIVDEQRQFIPPTPQELAEARANGGILQPSEATLLPDGSVHDKYLYSDYCGEHFVHGWTGNGYGMWMIMPNMEYQNGGPTTQELTVHQTETTPVILNTFQGAHYGSGQLYFSGQESWEKIYGPFYVYVNEGENSDDLWIDAKTKTEIEKQHWPYQWMSNTNFPTQRGSVQGALNITDGTSPENAWVVLAQPETADSIPNWQQQGKSYQFYGRVDSSGHFEIPHVRAGTYSLYAFVNGVPEEYRQDGVRVELDKTTDLGTIQWIPQRSGRKVWQIGHFDRNAGEYKHGEKFHDGTSWGMWYDYPTEFPDDVHFTIGSSIERFDWNYTQMTYTKPDGTAHLPVWHIYFDLDSIPVGQAVLSVGIAASRKGGIDVGVNGTQVEYDTLLEAGSACVRNSIQGTYQLKRIAFDSSILQPGVNMISIKHIRGNTFSNIMYDAIRLEIPWHTDLDNSGWVDIADLSEFCSQWLSTGSNANFNDDAIVDLLDFSILANEWLPQQ